MPVYKDKKTGKYYFSAFYVDVFGKHKRKVKRGFIKKKDAKLAESEFIQNIKNGYSDSQTFGNIFFDRLENKDLTEQSKRAKKNLYKKHLQDKFGHLPISQITIEQCKEFRKSLVDDEKISAGYARTIIMNFKSVFNYAKKNYRLTYDPSGTIETIPYTSPKQEYITREEFDKRVEEIEDKTVRDLTKLLFYTGLRVGEALPLQWKDYDMIKGELDVNKIVVQRTRKIQHFTKTEKSTNIVPVPKHIREILDNKYKNHQTLYKGFSGESFIFPRKDKHISYNVYTRGFKEVFPDLKVHSLRHSYATYLINNGIDMYLLMELMRHSNITQTIQTYSHLYTDKKQSAMKLFDK